MEGERVRCRPPGKNGSYWGVIRCVHSNGDVDIDFSEEGMGLHTVNLQQATAPPPAAAVQDPAAAAQTAEEQEMALQEEMQVRGYPPINELTLKLAYTAYMKMHGWGGDPRDGGWATPEEWGPYGTAVNCFMHKGISALAGGDVYGFLEGRAPLPGALAKALVDKSIPMSIGYAKGASEEALQQLCQALEEQRQATKTFTSLFGDESAALAEVIRFFEVAALEALQAQ